MKITLNKKNDPRGKHVVLVCERDEDFEVSQVVNRDILQGKARPVREVANGNTLYRFNLKYLDRLALAFTNAELSPGVLKKMRRAEEVRLAGMVVPKFRIPGFNGKLYDYQKIAVGLLLDGEIDLLNDEMGLGKTFVALAVIAKRLHKDPSATALCIVPNNAKYDAWASVLDTYFPEIEYVVYDAQVQDREERSRILEKRAQLTIVNHEAIRAKTIHKDPNNANSPVIGYTYVNPALFDHTYSVAVLDEHHRVKTPNAQVTNGFFQLEAERWIGMSGTPLLNRPEEIWTMLHKLYPDQFPSYDRFCRQIQNDRSTGNLCIYNPDAMAELRDFLRSISLRRRKDQVLKDLPPVVEVIKHIDLSQPQRELYEEIRDDLILRMEDGEIRTIGGALPQITRMKQACASTELYGGEPHHSKLDEMKVDIAQLVESGEKAIVFSQWSRMTRILQRELAQYNPAYVTGEIPSMAKRQAQIEKFRTDPTCKLYIGTIGANREGINLGNATYVLFYDEGWTPAGQDQAVGRSAAGGLRGLNVPKGTKVHVIIYRARDTYEQRVAKLLKTKQNVSDRFIERDGGKQIERLTLSDLRSIL